MRRKYVTDMGRILEKEHYDGKQADLRYILGLIHGGENLRQACNEQEIKPPQEYLVSHIDPSEIDEGGEYIVMSSTKHSVFYLAVDNSRLSSYTYCKDKEKAYKFRDARDAESVLRYFGFNKKRFTLLKKVSSPTYKKVEW